MTMQNENYELGSIEDARALADTRVKLVKRREWLLSFGKGRGDILTDEVGDEYICLQCKDSRCIEAHYLPDGLQHLGDAAPFTSVISGGVV